MHSRHEHTTGWSTHGAPRIRVREKHALCRHSVYVWREDSLLSVAAEFTVTQIIGHDEHNVWRTRSGSWPAHGPFATTKRGADSSHGGGQKLSAIHGIEQDRSPKDGHACPLYRSWRCLPCSGGLVGCGLLPRRNKRADSSTVIRLLLSKTRSDQRLGSICRLHAFQSVDLAIA